jgi:hypothetical protein
LRPSSRNVRYVPLAYAPEAHPGPKLLFFFFPTDIAESEKKLGELDAVLGRLMNIGK